MQGRTIAVGMLASIAMLLTLQSAHAQSTTMTAIALAESGGSSQSSKSKGLKVQKQRLKRSGYMKATRTR